MATCRRWALRRQALLSNKLKLSLLERKYSRKLLRHLSWSEYFPPAFRHPNRPSCVCLKSSFLSEKSLEEFTNSSGVGHFCKHWSECGREIVAKNLLIKQAK